MGTINTTEQQGNIIQNVTRKVSTLLIQHIQTELVNRIQYIFINIVVCFAKWVSKWSNLTAFWGQRTSGSM